MTKCYQIDAYAIGIFESGKLYLEINYKIIVKKRVSCSPSTFCRVTSFIINQNENII